MLLLYYQLLILALLLLSYYLRYRAFFRVYVVAFHFLALVYLIPFLRVTRPRLSLQLDFSTLFTELSTQWPSVFTALFLYGWFWAAALHYYIHKHKTHLTIVESKVVTVDEGWHFCNQFMVISYILYRCSVAHAALYTAMAIIYVLTLYFYITARRYAVIAYHVGAILALLFLLLLEPVNNVYMLASCIAFQTFMQWVITYRNAFGRMLIRCNIAGCAFIAEHAVVCALHVQWYTPAVLSKPLWSLGGIPVITIAAVLAFLLWLSVHVWCTSAHGAVTGKVVSVVAVSDVTIPTKLLQL